MRLDTYLTKHNNIQSRNKANELIKAGKVSVDGRIVTKPSFPILEKSEVLIDQEEFFVSRAAYKLKYFLEEFEICFQGKRALDIGSSTGGFTQVLLASKVASVTCVDVGTNQLHETLQSDLRIVIQENTDIREFFPSIQYDLVTCDVSFISILNILEDIDRLTRGEIIILYKPQFEVGREVKRDSKGVVLDSVAIENSTKKFLNKTESLGWSLIYRQKSQLAGKSGNVEELFYFTL